VVVQGNASAGSYSVGLGTLANQAFARAEVEWFDSHGLAPTGLSLEHTARSIAQILISSDFSKERLQFGLAGSNVPSASRAA
jgi:hypothetical protein